MLDDLAARLGQPNASEVFRFLVRREHARTSPKKKPAKKPATKGGK